MGNGRNYQFQKENWMLRREEHQRCPMDFNAFSFLFLLRQKMLSAAPFRICVNGTSYGIHAMYPFYNHIISNNKFRICSLYMSHLDYTCHNTCAIYITLQIWYIIALAILFEYIDEHPLTENSCTFGYLIHSIDTFKDWRI